VTDHHRHRHRIPPHPLPPITAAAAAVARPILAPVARTGTDTEREPGTEAVMAVPTAVVAIVAEAMAEHQGAPTATAAEAEAIAWVH